MIQELRQRLLTLLLRRRLDRELDDELAFHLVMKQERTGATSEEARRAFGNPTGIRERCRDLWTFVSLEALARDVRYAFRTLRRSPAFTLVAVLSLAIGIGGNTAIFSLAHAVLLKSLPVHQPQQLRLLTWIGGEDTPVESISGYGDFDKVTRMQTSGSFSYPAYLEMQSRLAAVGEVFAFRWTHATIAAGNEPSEIASAQIVSGNYFSALGVSPLIGRTIQNADDAPGAPPVALISHRFWQRHFALDSMAIGQSMVLNGEPFTVIGVLPPQLSGMSPGEFTDVYYAIAKQPANGRTYPLTDNGYWWVQLFARLRPGVSDAHFQSAANVVFQQMAMANAKPGKKADTPRLVVEPGHNGIRCMRAVYSKAIGALLAVVALVLLIACANLAGLLLARAIARSREMAVRLSIGAGRHQIVRQLLVESTMLSLAGGILGITFAPPLAELIVKFVPSSDFTVDTSLDSTTLLFTVAASLGAGILFGLLPAFRATRLDLSPSLKQGSRQAGGPRMTSGRLLVAAQVALSVLLLVGAGLAIRTLANLKNTDLGFNPSRMLVFGLDPTRSGYKGARLVQVYADVRERIATIPGVSSVVISDVGLISNSGSTTVIEVQGFVPPPNERATTSVIQGSDGYLTAMGIPLLLGRDLSSRDNATAPSAAVVSETFVKKFFPGVDPIGRAFQKSKRSFQIVGLAKDAKYEAVRKPVPPTMYVSYLQKRTNSDFVGAQGEMVFNVRTQGPPLDLVPTIRSAVAAIDPRLPLADLRTQEDQIAQSIGPERFFAGFASAFGLTAALLAALGLYGVLAYNVARRTSEIGIRVALGAERSDVLWLVLRESLIVVASGITVGLPAALAMTRFLGSAVYGIKPYDPPSFVAGGLAMLAIASLAAWLPARRAASVDPLVALRNE